MTTFDSVADVDQAIAAWTTDSVIPNFDCFWSNGNNTFVYDHPTRGFVFIPWDLDADFDFNSMPTNVSPTQPVFSTGTAPRTGPILTVLNHACSQYLDDVKAAAAKFNATTLLGRLDTWNSQILDAVNADPAIDPNARMFGLSALRNYVMGRAAFLSSWAATTCN
jgi:hypothetical protein